VSLTLGISVGQIPVGSLPSALITKKKGRPTGAAVQSDLGSSVLPANRHFNSNVDVERVFTHLIRGDSG
jgi:hypothetical protein